MQEIYKDIIGYDGAYQISNFGNVRTFNADSKGPRLLTLDGLYKRAKLHKNGIATRFLVHRLVATHFIPNPENKPFVNHIDNDPSNNHISNLEWCTQSENMQHSIKQGRQEKVTKLAAAAMAKANTAKAEANYDKYIGVDINGRILLDYYKEGKHYKGNFKCTNCGKLFTAYLDDSIRNSNRELPIFCRSCVKRIKI